MGLSRGSTSHNDLQGDGHEGSKELGDQNIYFAVELSHLVFLYDLR